MNSVNLTDLKVKIVSFKEKTDALLIVCNQIQNSDGITDQTNESVKYECEVKIEPTIRPKIKIIAKELKEVIIAQNLAEYAEKYCEVTHMELKYITIYKKVGIQYMWNQIPNYFVQLSLIKKIILVGKSEECLKIRI